MACHMHASRSGTGGDFPVLFDLVRVMSGGSHDFRRHRNLPDDSGLHAAHRRWAGPGHRPMIEYVAIFLIAACAVLIVYGLIG